MVYQFFADIMHINGPIFWLITAIAFSGAFMVKELTDRLAYSIIAFPILWMSAISGHVFLETAHLHFGVDPITDAIMGAMFGMSTMVLFAVFLRQAVGLMTSKS